MYGSRGVTAVKEKYWFPHWMVEQVLHECFLYQVFADYTCFKEWEFIVFILKYM